MKTLAKTLVSSLLGLVVFGALLFWPAGTFDYWQGWALIVVFTICTLAPSGYLLVKDPAALERRMHAGPAAETRTKQKIIMAGAFLLFPAVMMFSAFDHRFGWSPVPNGVAVLGLALVAIGLGLTQLVVIQNSYAAATITVEADQPVISTGLYRFVRHPMYVGVLVMMAGIPVGLASWWGLLALIPGLAGLVLRIRDEEQMLDEDLAGYREYAQHVRYRLLPHVW